jgi:iron complex transport system ATP-binding protein
MLEARDITVKYEDREVLSNVSLTLIAGETIVLLGANGSGKTTLIRSLNGTIPLSAGTVAIEGESLSTMSRREIARRIAVVSQENETRFPITVLEFVLSGRFVHGGSFGWENETDKENARKALAECELDGFGTRLMNHLSGGERQRVVLARALGTEASILLLDEPTANLDLAHQAKMFRLVRERCRSGLSSAVVITHDLNLASEFADRIIMLKKGIIAASGTPMDVLKAEIVKSVYDVNVLLDQNPASQKVRVTAIY